MEENNGNVMRYFIYETNRRLEKIEKKLDDLSKFKAEMLVSARIVSLIISSVTGIAASIIIKVIWQ